MGIDAEIDDTDIRVGDPQGLLSWALHCAPLDGTVCVRFIDPYDDTVFSFAQLPLLKSELETVAGYVTESKLLELKSAYLQAALKDWPPAAFPIAEREVEVASTSSVRATAVPSTNGSRALNAVSNLLVGRPRSFIP